MKKVYLGIGNKNSVEKREHPVQRQSQKEKRI